MGEGSRSPWNSLEATKLFVAILTPIAVAVVGFIVQQQIANQGRYWQGQQKILERRLQVYDAIRLELNRIYCFVEDVGTWKEDTPETIVHYKRDIDQVMHPQRALWSVDTFQAYLEYVDGGAFSTYQGIGTDAKIKTSDSQKRFIPGWKQDWSERLTGAHDPDHKKKYEKFIGLISRDLSFPSATSVN